MLDLTKEPTESNLKSTWEVPFKQGLSQDNAKLITKKLREEAPKVKAQIQGDAVRVTSSSKDELQQVIQLLSNADYDFAVQFINYR
ncbi:putative nucleotide-binding protein [compost metagenome]